MGEENRQLCPAGDMEREGKGETKRKGRGKLGFNGITTKSSPSGFCIFSTQLPSTCCYRDPSILIFEGILHTVTAQVHR